MQLWFGHSHGYIQETKRKKQKQKKQNSLFVQFDWRLWPAWTLEKNSLVFQVVGWTLQHTLTRRNLNIHILFPSVKSITRFHHTWHPCSCSSSSMPMIFPVLGTIVINFQLYNNNDSHDDFHSTYRTLQEELIIIQHFWETCATVKQWHKEVKWEEAIYASFSLFAAPQWGYCRSIPRQRNSACNLLIPTQHSQA